MASRTYYTADEVRQMIRDVITERRDLTAFADQAGEARGRVSEVLAGKRRPSSAIAAAFGLQRIVVYRKRRQS